VQAAGKLPLAFDADYLTLSAHKLGGPQGAGALIVNNGAPFAPLIAGLFVLTVSFALLAANLLSRLVDEPAVTWSRKFGRWGAARLFPSEPVTSSL